MKENKDEVLVIRITPTEKKLIKDFSERLGISMSEAVRWMSQMKMEEELVILNEERRRKLGDRYII